MIRYTHTGGTESCRPIGSAKEIELVALGVRSCGFLLNCDEYRNKWVSWKTFADIIETRYTSDKAKEVAAAMRNVVGVAPIEAALEIPI